MSATILEHKIIYEFLIPLPFIDNFHLYKVIPLPTRFKNNFVFIQPSTRYVLIDYKKEQYYNLDETELAHCKTQSNQFLCAIKHPLFNANANNPQCEIQILQRVSTYPTNCDIKESNISTVWIQLSQPNTWLFSPIDDYMVDEICQDTLKTHTLKNTATLEISGDCYLKTKDLTIRANNEENTYVHNAFIPSLNISNILTNYSSKIGNKTNKAIFVKYTSQNELKLISKTIES